MLPDVVTPFVAYPSESGCNAAEVDLMVCINRWRSGFAALLTVVLAVSALGLAGGVAGDERVGDRNVTTEASEIQLVDVRAPAKIGANETFEAEVVVRNQGDETGTLQSVALLVDGTQVTFHPTSPTNLSPGETVTGSLRFANDGTVIDEFGPGADFNWTVRLDTGESTDTVTGETAVVEAGTVLFEDRSIAGSEVTVRNVDSDGQEIAVVVSYPTADGPVVAGMRTGVFDEESVTVPLQDTGGLPGAHTAHTVPTTNLSTPLTPGDELASGVETDATAEVTATLGVEAITGQTVATDTTGDGLMNDIDGDGRFDIFDVQAFYTNLHDTVVQANPDLFGFEGDTDVTIFDVQALFSQL